MNRSEWLFVFAIGAGTIAASNYVAQKDEQPAPTVEQPAETYAPVIDGEHAAPVPDGLPAEWKPVPAPEVQEPQAEPQPQYQQQPTYRRRGLFRRRFSHQVPQAATSYAQAADCLT